MLIELFHFFAPIFLPNPPHAFTDHILLAWGLTLWFSSAQQVQRFFKLFGFGSVAKPAVAGLLAFLLLAATAFSASHNLHKSLHPEGAAASHGCLVCSLVSGHLSAEDVAVIALVLAIGFVFFLQLVQAPLLPGHDYRLSPSRAPPRA